MGAQKRERWQMPTEYEKLVKRSERQRLEDSLFGEFKLFGLPLPERQYMFHPTRKWRADFCWIDKKIIVEIHGGIFIPQGKGGHNRGAYMEETFDKQNEAIRLGFDVYIFGPKGCRRPKESRQASKALEFMYSILKP